MQSYEQCNMVKVRVGVKFYVSMCMYYNIVIFCLTNNAMGLSITVIVQHSQHSWASLDQGLWFVEH